MKRAGRRGLTLLEIVIAAVVLLIAALIISRLVIGVNRGVNTSMSDFEVKTAVTQLGGSLQRYLSSGDTRFYAFSGVTSATPPHGTLARFFLPLAGRCADLSTGCPEDIAFLYVHYDKTVSPSVSAICRLNATSWLVDTNNPAYGPNELLASTLGFNVLPGASTFYAVGAVPVENHRVLALMNPPYVTLWEATDKPRAVTFDYAAVPQQVIVGGVSGDLPPECAKALAGDTPPNPTAGVYAVTVAPLTISTVTGGTAPTEAEYRRLEGLFPMRLFAAEIRSVGRLLTPGKPSTAGLAKCAVGAGQTLSCNEGQQSVISGVERARVELAFKLALDGSTAQRFELLGPGQTPSNWCGGTDCATLPLPAMGAIPVQYGGTENYQTMTAAGFSLLKADSLSRIRFRWKREKREEVIDVLFP